MADFMIPKGEELTFSLAIKERDSYLPQDLTNIDTGILTVYDAETMCKMYDTSITVKTDVETTPAVDEIPAQEQVDTLTIAVIDNETEYYIVVNDTRYAYVSDDNATNLEIAAGLTSAMSVSEVSVIDNQDGTLTITGTTDYKEVEYSISSNMYITRVTNATEGEDAVDAGSTNYAVNGIMVGTMSSVNTETLIISRGPAVDGYYSKANYKGNISITFTDTTPDISAAIAEIAVYPIGVTCA